MQQQAPDLKIDLLSESSEANSPYSPSRSLTGLTIIKSNLSDFLPFGSKQAEKTKKTRSFCFSFLTYLFEKKKLESLKINLLTYIKENQARIFFSEYFPSIKYFKIDCVDNPKKFPSLHTNSKGRIFPNECN